MSGQADERGWSPPKLSTRLQGTWIQTANPWKTCQGQWPHICRGRQEAAAAAIPALEGTEEVSSMLMCAVPACPVLAGDGVRSKLNHAIPALPRVAPRLVIGMNIYWGIYKDLPINNCIHPSHQAWDPGTPFQETKISPSPAFAGLSPADPLPACTRSILETPGRVGAVGMALLPSAVEMLPTHQLWGPSSPRRITVPPIKAALLLLPSFCSMVGHAGAANQTPPQAGRCTAGHRPPPPPGKSLQNTIGSWLRRRVTLPSLVHESTGRAET